MLVDGTESVLGDEGHAVEISLVKAAMLPIMRRRGKKQHNLLISITYTYGASEKGYLRAIFSGARTYLG